MLIKFVADFMNIVSISMTEKNVKDLEKIKKERGLANASETVRSAINDALEKTEAENKLTGPQSVVLIISHSHETEKFVSQTKHAFQQLVKTQNHYCTTGIQCIDMFLLHGSGEKIRQMKNSFLKNKKIQKISMVLV